MAEFGSCQRNEPSGALHGLMRVRAFVQDDAHIFCTEDQITSETTTFCDLLRVVYRDLGFTDIAVKFSDRPEKRAGSDDDLGQGGSARCRRRPRRPGWRRCCNPGEGAFYGPKLEFVLRDAIGREWQLGTLQVDFVLPERLDAAYVGEDGEKHRPVMLHRAILGSFERFVGILIEHHAGRLAAVAGAGAGRRRHHHQRRRRLRPASCTSGFAAAGLRCRLDLRNEKIGYKVREHSLAKVPVLLVVGAREQVDEHRRHPPAGRQESGNTCSRCRRG